MRVIFRNAIILMAMLVLASAMNDAGAQTQSSMQAAGMRKTTAADRKAAAERRALAIQQGLLPAKPAPATLDPRGIPDYFNIGNYAYSPPMRKFVDSLPGLTTASANNLGQYIPVAIPDTTTYPGSDYYEIELGQYTERMHSDLPGSVTLRGYRQTNMGVTELHYFGPMILARKDRPVRIKFTNSLPTGAGGNLFIPCDTSVMGAGLGPDGVTSYTQNRATLHLHGGATPWISDGTPHQWTVPAGENTPYQKGVSARDVPDMPATTSGTLTFYYTNQQGARLMFYHDHSYGITRLNVYAGEKAPYVLTDQVEDDLIDGTNLSGGNPGLVKVLPDQGGGANKYGIPLIIQDKTFVPDIPSLLQQDPTWDVAGWGGPGKLWYPHVYMPNQNPKDDTGANAFGRWDYGLWFWPPLTPSQVAHGPSYITLPDGSTQPIPGTPNPSLTPEAFMDTPVINGTAYPYMNVQRKAYRFRVLNASNDRSLNLSLFYADDSGKEVPMVPALPHDPDDPTWPANWPADARDGGVPDPASVGPQMIQIGSEGGFLPQPVVHPNLPVNYEYNRRNIVVLNVSNHNLLLAPAERADVIVDFSKVPANVSNVILYNDCPAPIPASDPRYDFYTGNPDQTDSGGAPSTQAGMGPNMRTIMQFRVSGAASAPYDVRALQTVWQTAYPVAQPPFIVPERANGATSDTLLRIESTTITYNTSPTSAPLQPKAIQELFELNYGRMNATLGTELPFTNFNTQTTIPLGFTEPPTEKIGNGKTQFWKVTHNGVDTHAIHFHLFNVQLINRVGWDGAIRPPDPNEIGWKETVRMNPLEDAIVAFQPITPTLPFVTTNSIRLLDPTQAEGGTMGFSNVDPVTGNPTVTTNTYTDFGWEYVWHCHILGHEENDMMRPMPLTVTTNTVPAPPIVGPAPGGLPAAVPGNGRATVNFGTPLDNGGTSITYYTVTSTPDLIITSGTASPIFVSGLTNGTSYTFTVTATNAVGTSSGSLPTNSVIPGVTVPEAPAIGVPLASDAQCAVYFTPPASDGGSSITYYTASATPAAVIPIGAFGALSPVAVTTGTASPVTVTGLTKGMAYTFNVKATNSVGDSPVSPDSYIAIPLSLPGAPTIGLASGVNGSATVNFSGPADNGGTQVVEYIATSIPGGYTASGTKSPLTITGLPMSQSYTFTVKARNNVGIGPDSAASNPVTMGETPHAPTNVTARASYLKAIVSFTPPSNPGTTPISLYTVSSIPGGITATGTSSPITVTGLTLGQTYTFTVTAQNTFGMGAQSDPSNAVTIAFVVPDPPVIGTATPVDTKSISVTFTPPAFDGGKPITGYTVTSSPDGYTATGTSSPIIVGGLDKNETYTFTVTATNAVGNSNPSAPSNPVVPTSSAPPLPRALTAKPSLLAVTSPTVTLDWYESIPGQQSFVLQRSTAASFNKNLISIPLGQTLSEYVDTSVSLRAKYFYRIKAVNLFGESKWSKTASARTPGQLPAAPENLQITSETLRSLTITWTESSTNIKGFRIQRREPTGVWRTVASVKPGITTYTSKGLKPATSYGFRVQAYNADGKSAFSNEASHITEVEP